MIASVYQNYAQEDIGGQINEYARIKTIWSMDETNPDSVIVDRADTLWDPESGVEIVLFIQMKGMSIYDPVNAPGDPALWGQDISINNTGIYSFNLISRIVNDSIVIFSSSLREMAGPLTTPQTAQLITVPYYKSARLVSDLEAKPWDPSTGTGGVLALFATDKLDLSNRAINVSGHGFLGGDTARVTTDPVLCPNADNTFYLDTAEHLAGRKGESMVYEGYQFSRGNKYVYGGGGGGQGKNAGGAGGANFGAGGLGGRETGGDCSPFRPYGSWGGIKKPIHYGNDENRVFMGSGGGGSLPYSGLTATPGGNGGGIVIIITDTLAGDMTGDTSLIRAAGQSVTDVSYTGGGGGGAGGFIVLAIDQVEGKILLDVTGGKGGDTYDPVHRHGPGGPGGGGVIWHSGPALLPGLIDTISAGAEGEHLPEGVIVGTTPADPGGILKDLVIPLRGFFFNFISGDEDVCQDSIPSNIIGSYPKGDTGFVYTWQDSISGGSWQNIPGASGWEQSLYKDYSPDTLTETTWFRRIVTQRSDPFESDTSLLVEKTVFNRIRNNLIAPDDTICYDLIPDTMFRSAPALTGGSGVYSYRWQAWRSPAEGWINAGFLAQDGVDVNPVYKPGNLVDTTYFRRQVISHVCTHISDSLTVVVLPNITGNTITGDDHICQYNAPADTIRGTQEIGGGDVVLGKNAYTFVWEKSPNQASWDSISTDSIYFPGILEDTTYYHRIIYSGKDRTCKSISNQVSIVVDPAIQQNIIAPDTAVCAETPTNLIYPTASITGGNGIYQYTYEDSTLSAAWSIVRPAGAESTFAPPQLAQTTWYRRIVESGKCTDTSSVIEFYVDTVIVNNLITPDDTICSGTASDSIFGSVAGGGDRSSYDYLWDRSTDLVNWENGFYNARGLPPQVLEDSTWFRRRVLSGVCVDTSSLVVVNVHDLIENNDIRAESMVENTACILLPKSLFGTSELDSLGGGTGKPEDFEYLWEQYDPLTGQWNDAPADLPLSNNQYNYITDTLSSFVDSVYTYRRFVRSGKCSGTSGPITLEVKPRPLGQITASETDIDCFNGTDSIQVQVPLEFTVGTEPFTIFYSDGNGGSGMAPIPEGLNYFILGLGSRDSTWFRIRIDSIVDKYGCVSDAVFPELKEAIVYRDSVPAPFYPGDSVAVCGDTVVLRVVPGLGSLKGWGPASQDYRIEPATGSTADLILNNRSSDVLRYTLTWSQQNGWTHAQAVCPPHSVPLEVILYQRPANARIHPQDSTVFFRRYIPMWADPADAGFGTWVLDPVTWQDYTGSTDTISDSHDARATVDLGETKQLLVTRKLTWIVSNGVCTPSRAEVTIDRRDIQMYTAFSPNGDLFNEYLILDGLEFADKFTMRIFSRHGLVIKTITEKDLMVDPHTGLQNVVWDGKKEDGSEAEDGTYYYMIEVQHAGETRVYKNFLELVRTDPAL